MKNSKINTRTLVNIALMGAVSYVLAFLEMSVPFAPSFMKLDLSDFPALIAAFAFGPVSGIMVELVKNLLQMLTTSTGGVGELANFIIGTSFVLVAGLIYKKKHTLKGAVLACILGSLSIAVVGGLMNYFVMFPVYSKFMPMEEIIRMSAKILPIITTKLDVILYSVVPFNLVKGLIISLSTMLIYKKLSPLLKGGKL
jgi:riboflavin transporter FmnP